MQSDDPQFICPHLAEGPTDTDIFVWFTGHNKDLNWSCRACAGNYPTAPASWVPATPAWLAKNRDEVYWDGIRGAPAVKHRESGLSFANRDLELGDEWGNFVDARPVFGSPSCWRALSSKGKLVLLSTQEPRVIHSLTLEDLGFEITAETGLCLSPDNKFAVLTQASGPNAALINVETGKTIKKLSRGDYHFENSHFPVSFFRQKGKTCLIAASDWNRLDIYDPSSGEVLSERGPTRYENKERPAHYLDYFHGGLSISPDDQFIADNGWVWHPVGGIRSWSLKAWMDNKWESEDGPTSRTLAWRDYYWDGPVCWIDSVTLAYWGWGRDDEWLVPAVVLVDVRDGRQLKWFPGPKVRPPAVWPPRRLAESFFFDHYLFAVHDDEGTTVWDIDTGECLLTDPQVKPWRYHSDSKEFIEITPTGLRVSTLMM